MLVGEKKSHAVSKRLAGKRNFMLDGIFLDILRQALGFFFLILYNGNIHFSLLNEQTGGALFILCFDTISYSKTGVNVKPFPQYDEDDWRGSVE